MTATTVTRLRFQAIIPADDSQRIRACKDRIHPNARGQIRLEGPVATTTNADHGIDSQLVQRTVLTDEPLIVDKGV